MSDILDALRKAELARESSRGPGISTQQRYWTGTAARTGRWKLGLVGGAVLGVSCAAALIAYTSWGGSAAQPVSDTSAVSPRPSNMPTRAAPAGSSLNSSSAAPTSRPVGLLRTPGPRPLPAMVIPAQDGEFDDDYDDGADEQDTDPPESPHQMKMAMRTAPDSGRTRTMITTRSVTNVREDDSMVAVNRQHNHSGVASIPDSSSDLPAGSARQVSIARDPFAQTVQPRSVEVPTSALIPPSTEVALLQSGITVGPVVPAVTDDGKHKDGEAIPLLRTMPYRYQSTVPKLVINAQAYGETADDRFVVINMKRYGEGQQTPEGVRIESIRQWDTVLLYQGQKFRLQR